MKAIILIMILFGVICVSFGGVLIVFAPMASPYMSLDYPIPIGIVLVIVGSVLLGLSVKYEK